MVIGLFGQNFVNNKYNCIINYKNKIFPLKEFFVVENTEEDEKEIKYEIILMELEDLTDKSYMFHECKFLSEFSSLEIMNYKIKNYFDKTLKEYDNDEKSNIYNKCYSSYKINTGNDNSFSLTSLIEIYQELSFLFDKTKFDIYACLNK